MSNKVEVVRYIRPDVWFDSEEYAEFTNLYGITIIHTVDYDAQQVSSVWSICNNDNFSKQLGKELARQSKKQVVFPLEDVKIHGSLNEALWNQICGNYPARSIRFYEDVLKVFLKATRSK